MSSADLQLLRNNLEQVLEVLASMPEKKHARRLLLKKPTLGSFHQVLWNRFRGGRKISKIGKLIDKRIEILRNALRQSHESSIDYISECCTRLTVEENVLASEHDWLLRFDASNDVESGTSGLGCILVNKQSAQAYCFMVKTTKPNSYEAEKAALEFGLRAALKMKATSIKVHGDAKEVIDRCLSYKGKDCTKSLTNAELGNAKLIQVYEMLDKFANVDLEWVPRKLNYFADHLSRMARDRHAKGHKPMMVVSLQPA